MQPAWITRKRALAVAILTLALAATQLGLGVTGGGTRDPGREAWAAQSQDAASVVATVTVANPESFARIGEHVTSGIPLARDSAVVNADELALVGPEGPVPAQLQVTARWGGAPSDSSRPIRWLLADFAADVPPGGAVTYRLVRQSPEPVSDPIGLSEDATGISVDTGGARFRLSKTRFSLLEAVVLDGGSALGADGVTVRARGRDGQAYLSTTGPPRELTVETSGPLRATVRVSGVLRGGGDLVDATAWLHFYRGESSVKIDLRIENRRIPVYTSTAHPDSWDIGSPNSVWIDDLSVVIPPRAGVARAIFGTDTGSREVTLSAPAVQYQDSSGNSAWNRYGDASHPRLQSYTTFRGWRLLQAGTSLAAGNHAPGWVLVNGADASLGVALRRFWQQFPKALRVAADGTVDIGLFPGEFASDHNLRVGEYKTHEMLLDFDAAGDFAARARAFERPLVAAASPDHYARTSVFGPTAPRRDGEAVDYEDANRRTLEPNPDYPYDWPPNESMLARIDEYDFYGWQDFGDVPLDYEPAGEGAGQMNLKYNFDRGMWLQWARTGDARWLELADAGSRHIADIDILHAPNAAPHWANGGYFGHSYHDEPGNSNPNRNYGAPHPDLTFGTPGLLSLNYMTGYAPAREAALEIADNIAYRFDNTFGGNGEGWALGGAGVMNNNERSLANGLLVLTEAYRATGDPKYLRTARSIVAYARAADQPYIDGPTGSSEDFVKPWALNMYLAALGNYLEMLDEFGLPDNEGGRESLLRYADFQLAYTYRPLAAGRAAFPYEWHLDGTDAGPDVCDWLLVGADAMSYAYRQSGDGRYLEAAGRLFATGSADPAFEGDEPVYWWTKEAANNAVFGNVYLATTWNGAPPWWGDRIGTALAVRSSKALVDYGETFTLYGSLTTTDGPVADRGNVSLWSRPATGGLWARRATATYDPATASYVADARPTQSTVFQMRFSGDASYTASASDAVTVRARAYLSRPWTAPTVLRRGRLFSIYGYLAPRHWGTTRLYLYRQVGGRWSLYRRATATNYRFWSVTRYVLSLRLRDPGRYYVRAYHSDASHASTWSPARVFAVR